MCVLIAYAASSGALCDSQVGPPAPNRVPLAYIRRLIVLPSALATLPDPPLPLAPRAADKKSLAQFQAQRDARRSLIRLRADALSQLDQALTLRLARVPGLQPVQIGETVAASPASSIIWANAKPGRAELADRIVVDRDRAGHAVPLASVLQRFTEESSSDGVVAAAVDRFGIRSGVERQVWLRLVAYLAPNKDYGALRGPFYAYGLGRTTRRFIGKGYQKSDERLVGEAAAQAAGQLAHTLETGEEAPFTRGARVAIVPAVVPDGTTKQTASGAAVSIPLPALARQNEVLLQPEIGPVAVLLDTGDVQDSVQALGLRPEGFFDSQGRPDLSHARTLAARLKADYLFVSRLTDLTVADETIQVKDNGQSRPGVERRGDATAEAYLLRGVDGKILWTDRTEGSTIARTEYVRYRPPRLRTDEQCALDAARTAYAYLRASLEVYKQKFER